MDDESDPWWMSYNLDKGDIIVLTKDVDHYGTIYKAGTQGMVSFDGDPPHQSVNGTLANIHLEGMIGDVILDGDQFKPAE